MSQNMITAADRFLSWRIGVLLAILAGIAVTAVHYLLTSAYVELEVHSSEPTTFELYWAGEGQVFAPARGASVKLFPHRTRYALRIGNLSDIKQLRIDPANSLATVRLTELSIYQFGHAPVRLRTGGELGRIQVRKDIASARAVANSLLVVTGGRDPQLLLELANAAPATPWWSILWRAIAVFAACGLLLLWSRRIDQRLDFVPYAMLLAFCLVFLMSSSSRINAHPDEFVHLAAARYYVDHQLPPGACAEHTRESYSPYGVSRLNSLEIAYFLTGKFAALTAFVPIADALKLRYFNLFLFGLLLILAIRKPDFRWICLPVLATPQVWYLFSYVNSEGLALFASLLLAYQIVSPGSAFRQLLAKGAERWWLWLGLGLLAAVLILLKKNFYVFGLFAALWLVGFLIAMRRSLPWRKATARLVLPLALGLMVAGGWFLAHQWANDFERGERISQCRDLMANHAYGENTAVEDTHVSLYWRDKGRPFTSLFEHNWGAKVFRSAFGAFGYLEIQAGGFYYQLAAGLLLLFFGYLGYAILTRGGAGVRLSLAGGVLIFLIILGATLWKAWTRDFQPQGRYFFPMIPVIAMILANAREAVSPRVLGSLMLLMFSLAVYFFVFVGLAGIKPY